MRSRLALPLLASLVRSPDACTRPSSRHDAVQGYSSFSIVHVSPKHIRPILNVLRG